MKKLIVSALVASGMAVSALGSAMAQQQFVSIGTGGVTGVYYPTGGAICRLVNKLTAVLIGIPISYWNSYQFSSST